MQDAQGVRDNEYLAMFLRANVGDCIRMITNYERGEPGHEDQVNFEQWVRFWLTCQLIPDILALACGISDFDGDAINQGIPDLLRNALPTVPLDAEFVAEVMERLPDQGPMEFLAENLLSQGDSTSLALGKFNDALHWTMEINHPDE